MPETFHGAKPKKAVDHFEDKIEAVASREDKLRKAEAIFKCSTPILRQPKGHFRT